MRRWIKILCWAALLPLSAATTAAQAAGPATGPATDKLAEYAAQAGAPGNAARGQTFFTQKHGREWSCASCHQSPPSTPGRHASTGKTLQPLAPAFNPERFTDARKTEKWFRRNCNDVLGRECSAGEKADVMAYLISIQ